MKWLGHVECKDDTNWFKHCMSFEVEGIRQRGGPKKTWWDCDDTKSLDLSKIMHSLGITVHFSRLTRDSHLLIKVEPLAFVQQLYYPEMSKWLSRVNLEKWSLNGCVCVHYAGTLSLTLGTFV